MTAARAWRSGRPLVILIFVVPLAMALWSVWFRSSSREEYVAMLAEEGPSRIRAFSGLLQMNALRKLSRQYAYLPKDTYDGPHRHYARRLDEELGELYFLQGFDMDVRGRDLQRQLQNGAVFVVDAKGEVRHALRGGRIYRVGESPGRVVVVVPEAGEGDVAQTDLWQVSFIGREVGVAVQVRGGFRLETVDGEATIPERVADGSRIVPRLRYVSERECFEVEAAAEGSTAGLVRQGSPGLCPQ